MWLFALIVLVASESSNDDLGMIPAQDYGVVIMDNHTLPLLVGQHVDTVVRFDREHPYGDEQTAFREVSRALARTKTPLLIGHVGVRCWGERMNEDMMRSFASVPATYSLGFGDMKTFFPVFVYFPKGVDPYSESPRILQYHGLKDANHTKEEIAEDLTGWIKRTAKVWFGQPGTVMHFDKLASLFVHSDSKEEKAVFERARAAYKAMPEPEDDESEEAMEVESAKYYVHIMEKVLAKGHEWLGKEQTRLHKLLTRPGTPRARREEFRGKINILSSFRSPLALDAFPLES